MTSKNNKSENPSILSKNFKIQGEIESEGILEIEGQAKGSIKGSSITIRQTGIVEGNINCESINIHGSFSGDIKANNINIFKNAEINGNIEYDSLSVEDGASIDGQFKKISEKSLLKAANENNNIKQENTRKS
ncbi:polymer-forming cytoskeletal protein [Rickettsiales bacterium]|nr:polymer-forming cytoskeletal protein [Rickettsiales bacterium]